MSIVFDIKEFDKKNRNLACFDYDWTLVKPKEGRTFPKNKQDWTWLRKNVPETLKKLNEKFSIYVFTNQTKEWKLEMIRESLETLNIPIRVVVGFGKDGLSKPNARLFTDNVKVKFTKKSFFTGDAAGRSTDWSDSDKEFAKNVGITFKIPEDIFPIIISRKADSKSYKKSNSGKEIVILVGYPASGKSTFARTKLPSHHILSGDELKTLPKMIKEAKKQLDAGKSVVFDATNPKPENRSKIIELAKTYKIPVRCFVSNVDIDTAFEWNTKRMNETGKKVPKVAFYVFRKNYVRPTKEECKVIDIN